MSLQENLYNLFLLDKQVRGMRRRLDASTGRLNAQTARLGQFTQQHTELQTQLKHNQAKATGLENQAKDIQQRIEHLRQQMQNVTNNKEYSAVLLEVNTLKEDKSKVEDEALEQMEQIDTLKREIEEMASRVQEQEKLVEVAQAEVETCRTEVGQQLNELEARRNEAEQQIPIDARTLFNRMADMHEGNAMVPVSEESRRHMEYTCGGCYITIPAERVNALMTQKDQIICCPSCSRILYIEKELQASIGSK